MAFPSARACLLYTSLLRLDVVLNINEQADLSVLLFRLAGRSGASGDPGGKGFFGVVHTQGFQTGKPFLIRRSGGDIFAPVSYTHLHICKKCVHGCKQSFRVCLVACPHYSSKRAENCENKGGKATE